MSGEFSFVLAKKLKELRKSVCMTQDDVAMLIGMNRTSFSKYENGAANPPLAVLRKLAKLYAVPIESLIVDDVSKNFVNSADTDELLGDFDLNEISMFFSKLSPDERMMILKMRMLSDEDKNKIKDQIDENLKSGV